MEEPKFDNDEELDTELDSLNGDDLDEEVEVEEVDEDNEDDEGGEDGDDDDDNMENNAQDDADIESDDLDNDSEDDDEDEDGEDGEEHDEDDMDNSTVISKDDDEYDENDDDDDEDDEDDEETYLFDENVKENIIENTHTLLKVNNMSEIKALAFVTRDANNKITDTDHTTMPILTKYEKAKILGIRANQINNGCKPFVKTTESDIDGYLIAEKELYEKKIPFIIKRPLPSGKNEYWHIRDLELVI